MGVALTTPARESPLRVALIEDQPQIRAGIAALIDRTAGFTSIGQYGSMEEALAGIGQQPPDVVLVDIGLPGMSGIEGIAVLRERWPALPVLVLTVYDDDERI